VRANLILPEVQGLSCAVNDVFRGEPRQNQVLPPVRRTKGVLMSIQPLLERLLASRALARRQGTFSCEPVVGCAFHTEHMTVLKRKPFDLEMCICMRFEHEPASCHESAASDYRFAWRKIAFQLLHIGTRSELPRGMVQLRSEGKRHEARRSGLNGQKEWSGATERIYHSYFCSPGEKGKQAQTS
jgi:hypothetical protein